MSSNLTRHLTRMYRAAKPISEKVLLYLCIAAGVFFILLDVDMSTEGSIYDGFRWIWHTAIYQKPSVTFLLGMLTSYLIFRNHIKRKAYETHPARQAIRNTPLRLGVKDIEESAKKMGVELRVDDVDEANRQ